MKSTNELDGLCSASVVLSSPKDELFSGGGVMGRRLRAFDWTRTALGPIETWSSSLKTAVGICLDSRFPMVLWWGPDLTMIYNDAYVPLLGPTKDATALGAPGQRVWSETWHVLAPMLASVLEQGKATWNDDGLLEVDRYGYLEEAYFTWSYSPIRCDRGKVGGVFTAVTETTDQVLRRRRLRTLRSVAEIGSRVRNVDEFCGALQESVAGNRWDVPWSFLYFVDADRKGFTLARDAGGDGKVLAATVSIDDTDAPWPLARVLREGAVTVEAPTLLEAMPSGPWNTRTTSALLLPVFVPGSREPIAVLGCGVNPRRVLDDEYRRFFADLAERIGSTLAAVFGYEAANRRAEELAELDRAKTQFFSNVSHEFRTPLTLMLGPLEDLLARRDSRLTEPTRDTLSLVHRNGVRLLRLVNALLDFSRLEAGRAAVRFERTELGSFTTNIASVFRSAFERAGLAFVVRTEKVEALVDREMWESVVLNLLSNALKFTFTGRVEVALERRDATVVLRVVDTGIGVPESELEHVFKRFHRIEGARGRSYEGTGIGLAHIHEIVSLHGGTVSIDSREGSGTRFTVQLPVAAEPMVLENPESADVALAQVSARAASFVEDTALWFAKPERLAAEKAPTAAGRVLVVDDNPDMRTYLAALLEGEWEVDVCSNGVEALQRVQQKRPNLVLSDVMMPLLDGFGLVRALRAAPETRSLPIVLLSARAGEQAVVEGLEVGADDYLVKPFSSKELVARVRSQRELGALRQEVDVERNRLNDVLMQAPIGVCMLEGPELAFSFVNPRYLSMFFDGDPKLLGKPIAQVLPDACAQEFLEILRNVHRTGETRVAVEVPVQTHTVAGRSKTRIVDFVFQPVRRHDGAVRGVLALVTDVSEKVEARRQLRETAAELRSRVEELDRSNRELAQFAYVASHDLKEPLRIVRAHLQLIERWVGEALSPRAKEHMAVVMDASARMYALIDDLLEFSRVSAHPQSVGPVDADAAVRRALASLEPLVSETQASVDVAPLPSVVGVETHVEQLFQNLIGNALKFRSDAPPRIAVGAKPENDGTVRFFVSDNGIGIEAHYCARIFEVFQRLHDRSAYTGTGIGLAICKKIVERHGGAIGVESRVGVGSKFHFTLPLASAVST